MSVQDDIFYLESKVEELDEKHMAKAFRRIKDFFYGIEEENDELRTQNVHLKAAYLDSTLKKYRTG